MVFIFLGILLCSRSGIVVEGSEYIFFDSIGIPVEFLFQI